MSAGEYRLQWQIEGDGANEIRLSCSNGARIEPSVLPVEPGVLQGEAAFRLLDVLAAVTAACLLVQDVRRRRKEVRHAGKKG